MVHQKSYKLNIQIALYHGSIITSPYTGSMIIFLWTSERGLCGRGGTSLLLTWGTPVEEDEGASTIFRLTVNTTDPVCSSILFRTWVNDYDKNAESYYLTEYDLFAIMMLHFYRRRHEIGDSAFFPEYI